MAGQRWWVVLGAFLVAVHQAAEALVLVVVGEAIDRAVVTGNIASLGLWIGLLALLFAGLSAAGCIGWWINERAVLGTSHEVRMWITKRAVDPGGISGPGAPPGELVSLATSDADQVGEAAEATAFFAGALSALAVSAAVLFGISTSLGLIVLLGLPPLLVLIRVVVRPLTRRTSAEQAAVARTTGVATDLISGLRILKGLGAERAATARYRTASRASLDAALASARVEAAGYGILLALTGAFLAVVALVGGRLAANGEISVGQLVAAVGLAQFLIGPLSNLAEVGAIFARSRASAERVSAFLATPPTVTESPSPNGDTPPSRRRGAVALRGVSHNGRLDGLDLDVRPGETLGVASAGGEDADALVELLAREADPDQGTLTLDGVPFASVGLDDLRAVVLVAPHDAELFSGTLAENVHPDPDRLAASLATAGADEVADALPGGPGAVLGEGGRTLSGGQRQRVALARALAAAAPVLVLHEPTTAVDALTEHRITSRLRVARSGRTTVLVTTSPALLAAADRVVLIEAGAVSAEGTHESLVASSRLYRSAVLS